MEGRKGLRVGLFVLLILAALPAGAGPLHDCALTGWSLEIDPAGLNIRSGPGTRFAVIGRVPTPPGFDGSGIAPELAITGAQDGWLRISDAWFDDYGMGSQTGVEELFSGTGWISGRKVGLELNRDRLFTAPSLEAPVATLFDAPGLGGDTVRVTRIVDCTGKFARIEGVYDGKPVAGWADWTCANQVTTCP